MSSIDAQRLLGDLHALRQIGRWKTGVHRPAFSDDDVRARAWIAERFAEASLDVETDGIGNVIGRTRNPEPALLIGSHVDTQPYGGWLDGALGVIYGLEIARSLPHLAIDVASWSDEEGHYGSFIGSRSFIGDLGEEEIDGGKHRDDGTPLRVALERAGYAGRPRTRIEPERYRGYLEAHIEQGDELDSGKLALGVVTSIVGIWQYRIGFEGAQNHAGTTRMAVRRDAGVALVNFAHRLYEEFARIAGPRTVWTTGRITLTPGAPSVIPGGAEMIFQFRDEDPDLLQKLETRLLELGAEANAKGPCRVVIENHSRARPKLMDATLQEALYRAAKAKAPDLVIRMPSGAGHDAQILAQRVPAAMLFVPSIGGISHNILEETREEDIVLGCEVMADAVQMILEGQAGS